MINTLFVVIFYFLVTSCASIDSSIVIEGNILNETGGHVQFASINIAGREMKTNENGFFCYEGMAPKDPLLVSSDVDGYKNISQELEYGDYELKIILPYLYSREEPSITFRTLNDIQFDSSVRYCVKKRMEQHEIKAGAGTLKK